MKLKWTKNKIISAFIVVILVVGSFFYGDGTSKTKDVTQSKAEISQVATVEKATKNEEDEKDTENTNEEESEEIDAEQSEEHSEEDSKELAEEDAEDAEETKTADENQATNTTQVPEKEQPETKAETKPKTTDTKNTTEQSSSTPEMEINPDTGKDKYQTDPVPEDKPAPVEPEETTKTDVKRTGTLSVSAHTILDNIDRIDPAVLSLIPKNGVIYSTAKVTFQEGDSVFDVLQREMRNAGIHMEASFTPMYNSAYVEGINNLYEFDGGDLSGWMYKVNGWFPNYGASRYVLEDGDKIEWVYTLDLGRDVGDNYYDGY